MNINRKKKEQIKEQIKRVLDYYNENYNDIGLDTILNAWEKNKGGLIDVMSKHPNYDKENFWIPIKAKVGGSIDYDKLNAKYEELKEYLNDDETEIFRELMFTGYHGDKNYKAKQYISQKAIEKICKGGDTWDDIKLREGEKTISIIIKFIKHYELIDKFGIYIDKEGKEKKVYYKWEADVSDLFACKEKEIILYLSANPLDYFTMSSGVSWGSCYIPGDGAYRAGLLSYMCDPSTLIAYTTNGNKVCDVAYRKINRQTWFVGEDGSAIQNRLYPQEESSSMFRYYDWGDAISAELEKLYDIHYQFKEYKSERNKNSIISNQVGYVDTFYNLPSIGYYANNNNEKIKVAQRQYFIDSNDVLETKEKQAEFGDFGTLTKIKRECYECGSHNQEMHLIDGEWYCEDCCFYCEYHREWEVGENCYIEDCDYYVCKDAIGDGYMYCDYCQNYHKDNSAVYVNGNAYCCPKCAYEAGYRDIDGEWYRKEDVCICDNCVNDFYYYDGIMTQDGFCYCCEECAEEAGYIKNEYGEWVVKEEEKNW